VPTACPRVVRASARQFWAISLAGFLTISLVLPASAQLRVDPPLDAPSNASRSPQQQIGGDQKPETIGREASTDQPSQSGALVSISAEDLKRFAKLEDDYEKLQKRFDELNRASRDAGPSASGLGPIRRLLGRIAEELGHAIDGAVYCSATRGSVDDNLKIRIAGAVRDRQDLDKIRQILAQNALFEAFNSAGFVDFTVEPDGGRAGGCVVPLEQKSPFFLTKENKDTFRIVAHEVLLGERSLAAQVPDKNSCAQVGRLVAQLRDDASNIVPQRQKALFNSFWVRDSDQLTLCREDGDDWQVAPAYRVKPGWEGLLITSKAN
jgi:hypothetical protein